MSTRSGTVADYLAFLDELDSFLTSTGHAWGKVREGTGTGDLIGYIGTATSVAETFTLTATSETNFTVSGSVSGPLSAATVGTLYTGARIRFTITAGGTPFIAGDRFFINTSPAWLRLRAEGSPDQSKRASDFPNVETILQAVTSGAGVSRIAQTGFIEWEMHRTTEIRKIIVQCDQNIYAPAAFTFQWRDSTGDAWTTAATFSGLAWVGAEAREFAIPAAGLRRYWRLNITATTDTNPTVALRRLHLRSVQIFAKATDNYSLGERFELVWRAPGLDGTKQIHVGVKTYGSTDADTWNLGYTGFRAFDSSRAVDLQPNGETGRWASMIKSPIAYWFVANGQRVIVIAKFSGLYQTAYLGFGLPYEPPSVHPYPEVIGASHTSRTRRYDSTSADYRCPADPGLDGLALFYPDAQWRFHANRRETGGTEDGSTHQAAVVWPNRLDYENDNRPLTIRENIDGSRQLMPLIPVNATPGVIHTWGELEGYFWTTGFGTVAEAVIRDANFDHLVVNNVFRTGVQHYAAIRLD